MPIAVLSVDSANLKLEDFKDLTSIFNLIYVSTTTDSNDLYNKLLGLGIAKELTVMTKLLDPPIEDETDNDIRSRFQYVVDQCSGGASAIIISHHSVINKWKNDFIDSEWTVI